MMKIKLLFIIILLLMCSGCDMMCKEWGWFCDDTITQVPTQNTQEDIKNATDIVTQSSETISQATGEISEEANKITAETTEVQRKIPPEAKKQIDPHLITIKESSTAILEDATIINKATAELAGAKSLLKGAEKKVVITEEALNKMAGERDLAVESKRRAEADRDSALHKAIKWLIMSCIVGAGALGVFGFMYGNKMCLTLSAVCIVIMSIAIFVETYFIYLVIGGGIILACLVALMIYQIYVQKKAFKEVVNTVEIAQENLSEDAKTKLFGGKGQTGIMDALQSKNTMDLVQKEKNKMSDLWTYAKVNGEK